MRFVISTVLLALLPKAAAGVLVEAIDFDNNGSAWTVTANDAGLPLLFELGGDPTKVGFQHPNTTDTGQYNLFTKVSAPAGFSMSNIRLEALGSGYSSWIMEARIGMGFAPQSFSLFYDYHAEIGTEYNAQYVVDQPLVLDATGDQNLNGLSDIFVGVEVAKGLSHVSTEVDISQLKLYADLTPLPTVNVPDAREPLTFQSSGLYGGWNGYFVNPTTPFDHHVVPAGPALGDVQHNTNWNGNLLQARSVGKRIIAEVVAQASDGQGGFFTINHLTASSPESDLDKLADVINEFLTEVDKDELYGITLGEEHIFWNGRVDHLNGIYDRVKAVHPDVPIFQWYSPSVTGSAPGVTGYYNLNSDGWVSDEYYLDQPDMEKNMRAYIIQQKPNANVVWAGGDANSVPYIQDRFDGQIGVHQKYDIPASYFTYTGVGGAWGWSAGADPITAARFEIVKSTAEAAKLDPGPDMASWDTVPWETTVIELTFLSQSDVTPFYSEDYTSDRVVRFINDTDITGFANLRWDSSAVELRPRDAGAAQSSVAYSYSSAFPLTEVRINAPGFITGGTDGAVSMSVLDADGSIIQTTNMSAGGAMGMVVPGGSFTGREFQVVYTMTGTAASVGDVLAGVNSMDVDADVVIPAQKAIDLGAGTGSVLFEEDLRAMSIYHTAEFNNIGKITYSATGLHAGPGPGVLEVIQEFSSQEDIALTTLRADGSADQNNPTFLSTIGIGISLDGVNVLGQLTSSGTFNGELVFDVTSLSIESNSFFVHLFLDGDFGLIRSYSLEGIGPGIDGDFDVDGDVDGNDFLLWQRNPAIGDLVDWQTNYGMGTNALIAAQTNVPEPTSAMLFGIALIALTLVKRDRK